MPLPLASVLAIAAEYEQAARYDAAADLLGAVLEAAPDQQDALHLMGVLAFRENDVLAAVRLMERAVAQDAGTELEHRPIDLLDRLDKDARGNKELELFSNPLRLGKALVWRNLCTLYERVGRYDEAISAGRRAVALDPTDPFAHHNLGIACYRLLRFDEAAACARQALRLDPTLPDAHFALAEALLMQGEFPLGWEEYEWRFRLPEAGPLLPKSDRPQWDGAPIRDGRLLLLADQGFGDVIQFSRYIPWVRERCPDLLLACGVELLSLLRHNFPWLPLTNRLHPDVPFSAFCPLSGLPRLHGTTLDTIFAPPCPMRAVPDQASHWRRRLDGLAPGLKRRVGIVWAGRATPPGRSMSLSTLAPLATVEDIVLVALQKGSAQSEVAQYYGRAPLVNLGPEIADFADTAAIIEHLDLVVTIDTAVSHLAASMGKPVWIMLPYSPDWRWLRGRPDSPWYPTARLFRQAAPGQWGPVAARVAEALGSGHEIPAFADQSARKPVAPPNDGLA